MLSPLCIREHNEEKNKDYYYSIQHKDFFEITNKKINRQLIDSGINGEVEMIYVSGKKMVVKHYGIFIECTIGRILLKGDKKALQHLYENGIGSRKSAGFGMFEIK